MTNILAFGVGLIFCARLLNTFPMLPALPHAAKGLTTLSTLPICLLLLVHVLAGCCFRWLTCCRIKCLRFRIYSFLDYRFQNVMFFRVSLLSERILTAIGSARLGFASRNETVVLVSREEARLRLGLARPNETVT